MKTTSYKVSDTLYLVRQELDGKAPKKQVDAPVNHVAVIDCSGSMSYDLPKIREQLKKKLPKLLREKDTVSLVWFSGRGEFGTLLEAEPVATLADLKDVNQAIDRWLKPVGLTGFKEPMEEVARLVERVGKKRPGAPFALFFMSDGCDNQWGRGEILKAVEKAAGHLASATFVEYGYYADRPLLTQMAEKAGGTLMFSEDFDRYAPAFEAVMQRKVSGAPRIEVSIKGDPVRGFAWIAKDGDLVTYGVEGGTVHVPEDSDVLYYLSPSQVGASADSYEPEAAYAAMSLFSVRMVPDVVFPFLKLTGDVAFIEQFSTCFGKQKYSEFMDAAKAAAFDPSVRLAKGFDPNRVPKDDAFTVLHLLEILSSDEENRLLLDHESFKYSRISRGRTDAGEALSAEEIEQLQELTSRIAAERDVKKLKELQDELASLTARKAPALKFEQKPAPDGYPISGLTFNEDRPNVSVLVKKHGTVDLSSRLPDGMKVPSSMDTFVYRNYAIVRDGLVNVEKLPVLVSAGTFGKLSSEGIADAAGRTPPAGAEKVEMLIDLRALPVVNRKMVKSVSARELFEKEYELCKARAAQKVYGAYKKERFPRVSEGFSAQYGEAVAGWLKEQGITDYSGFSPKTVQAEAKDFYVGKELKVSLKGLSSLPSLKEVKEKMAKGKLNAAGELMAPYVREVEDFLASPAHAKAAKPDQVFEAWIDGQLEVARQRVRGLIFDLARIKFSVVVGQVWFTEFKSIDENSMDVQVDGKTISGKVEQREIEIKI